MRRSSLFVLLALTTWLRADIPGFWLDSPAGRDNPHDPKNPSFSAPSNLPLAPPNTSTPTPTPTPSPTDTITAGPSPTASATFSITETWTITDTPTQTPPPTGTFTPTATITPTPSATPVITPGTLQVRITDSSGNPVVNAWVQANDDSPGAKLSDGTGTVNFSGVSLPANVDIFPPGQIPIPVISILGVSGPTLNVGNIGGSAPNNASIVASVSQGGTGSVGYELDTFDAGGHQTGGQGSGASGNPALIGITNQTQGDTANFMAFRTDTFGTAFIEAGFAPPFLLSGPANGVSLSLSSTGWTSVTIPVSITDSLSGNYYFHAQGGSSSSNYYDVPIIQTYSSSSPTATIGPVLFPAPSGFCSVEVALNSPGNPGYSRYVHLTGTAAPASLNVTMPQPLQWTRSPTGADPHLTVLNPDPGPVDMAVAVVYGQWEIVRLQPPAGQGIDASFPSIPAGVTGLTPFAGAGPYSAMAYLIETVAPIGASVNNSIPYILRYNGVSVSY